jgi:ATP adenylyltransferase
MREGLSEDEDKAWDVLASQLLDEGVRGRVPFRTFAVRIGKGLDLYETYLRLYRRACEAVLGSEGARLVEEDVDEGRREARVDYNLAMTRDVMVIAPRLAEGEAVTVVGEDGVRKTLGKLAVNGTVLAGTALVKSQEEWDALRAEPEQVLEILGRIGVPTIQAPSLL